MITLIPSVKALEQKPGFLGKKAIFFAPGVYDNRLCKALEKLPVDPAGTPLTIAISGTDGDGYSLRIDENAIAIEAESPAGAFYAIQTLRQIFRSQQVPCLYIQDKPDFAYRGFYHDVTRGKVPTLESVKELIDLMAYYKLNSLQLYVEHACELAEYGDLIQSTGYLTKDEMKEIDRYCQENFIEFIPSLSTFGHLYELLEREEYKHLRVLKDYSDPNFWRGRMRHHTIDPREPESIEVIKSLIDQYIPLFTSDTFNICCDETFDLKQLAEDGYDVGKLYCDFVKQIIDHVKSRGKKVMMWGDILLQYPEQISALPEDTCFLNWFYRLNPPEENVIRFAQSGKRQIVCPGTTTWNRFCEGVDVEENNICLMAEYGYKHGADGVLNTNWGDWGNPCSVELAMYGLVLGAEKSWSVSTPASDEFRAKVNELLYENERGVQYLTELSRLHDRVKWVPLCIHYFHKRYNSEPNLLPVIEEDIQNIQKDYLSFVERLSAEADFAPEYRAEMLAAAEGICLMAELYAKDQQKDLVRVTDAKHFLKGFRDLWVRKNKESELRNLEEMFSYLEEN